MGYPTTTEVSGRCATSNSDLDSFGNYLFERCSDDTDINFDDLWFAMLGGGGGTYGIVTVMSIQLQEYKPLEYVAYDIQGCFSAATAIPSLVTAATSNFWFLTKVQSEFIVDFLLDPTKLEVEPPVTPEESNACGIVSTEQAFYCYGKNSGVRVADAWKQYWLGRKGGLVASLTTTGEVPLDKISSEALIDTYAQCLSIENQSLFVNFNGIESLATYFSLYYAFGDNTKNAQDNSVTALSDGYRNAGVMIYYQGTNEKFWKTVKDAYDFNFDSNSESDSSIFPSYVGSNHVMATTVGPKKDNYSLICPFSLTLEERKKECVSTQTIIYGGNKLKRLEQIKEDLDPDFLLDCAVCVRNDYDDDYDYDDDDDYDFD